MIIIYKDLLVCLEPLLRGLGHADPGSLVQALQVLMIIKMMIKMIAISATTVMIRNLGEVTRVIFLMIMIMTIKMMINMMTMIRSLREVTREIFLMIMIMIIEMMIKMIVMIRS